MIVKPIIYYLGYCDNNPTTQGMEDNRYFTISTVQLYYNIRTNTDRRQSIIITTKEMCGMSVQAPRKWYTLDYFDMLAMPYL